MPDARSPRPIPPGSALGLLETHGLVAAVEAADAMLKASAVRLVRQQRTVPALVTHMVVGDTAAVRSAVDAGAAAAARVGRVAASHVIPSPSADVWRVLVGAVPGEGPGEGRTARPASGSDDAPGSESGGAPGGAGPDGDEGASGQAASGGARRTPDDTAVDGLDYASQTVRELRALARDRDDERLSGRAIASASKDELVAFLRETEPAAGGAA